MKTILPDSVASLDFTLEWADDFATHTDCIHARQVNFWRDIFPPDLYRKLIGKSPGDSVKFEFVLNGSASGIRRKSPFSIKKEQFDRFYGNKGRIEPRRGRFYPKGILKNVSNVFKANISPFRLIETGEKEILVDFDHPLKNKKLKVTATVKDVRMKAEERGGSMTDWMETLTEGPGMQGRRNLKPTDFFSDCPFVRTDEKNDGMFYTTPRMVQHIDDKAIEVITGLHDRFLRPGMEILDLMSSWQTHIPANRNLKRVAGLGMNREELENNPHVTDYRVHDLNEEPNLPFADGSFDLVICSVSVEYLIHPFVIFREVARVLKSGGFFVVTFSNRRFPAKTIRIWESLHEFERMGLVTEYFLGSGRFENIGTFSMRGLPRPATDKYFPNQTTSDPVYAVWGIKSA